MNSKAISRLLGKSVVKRKIGFHLLYMTTLWEWTIRKAVWQAVSAKKIPFAFLDSGSGMGQHAFAVAKKYPQARVLGIELDREQVDDCNHVAHKMAQDNLRFRSGDLADFKAFNAFDVILCSHILEHIQEDVAVIRALYNGLKKGGTLIVYVPTSERRVLASLDRTIHKMVRKAGMPLPHDHIRYYTREELCGKLERQGFYIQAATVTYGSYGRLAYDIVTSVQYSPFFLLIFPFYLVFIHPLVLVLMWADYCKRNREGNGLLIVAVKRKSK